MSNLNPKPREPKDDVKCPLCSLVSRRHGYYFQVNEDGSVTEVMRYFCSKGCRRTFVLQNKIKVLRKYNDPDAKPLRYRDSSRRNQHRKMRTDTIKDFIKKNGFTNIDKIEEELKISRKTYYKYLYNLGFHEIPEKRDGLPMKEMLLLNWFKVHTRTQKKFRFLFLIDLKSRVVFDFFQIQAKTKKKLRPPEVYGDITKYFGNHSYNSRDLSSHLEQLSSRFPLMTIALDESIPLHTRRKLTSSKPELYCSKKPSLSKAFRNAFKDYGTDKVIDLSWSILERKHFKRKSWWIPRRKSIHQTMKLLLSIYNTHHLELFEKKLAPSKNQHTKSRIERTQVKPKKRKSQLSKR